jgi:HEAT repeats
MPRCHDLLLACLGAAGLASLILAGGTLAADDAGKAVEDSRRPEVAIHAGVLTVQAHGVPLAEVLAAIGQRAGFEVTVRGAVDARVSVVLAEVPLEEGLRQLLRGRSFAFLYDRARAHPAAKLVEVRVYALEKTAAQPEPGRAAASTSKPSAMSGDANHHAPVISPFDPLEARLEFARIEARRGKPTSPEDLITLLLEDEHAQVRGLAASALGRLKEPAAGDALVDALTDRDGRVRRRAVRALGEARGQQAVAPLAALLLEERTRGVRRVAAHTLSRIGGDAAMQILEPLQFDLDPQVRRIATFALEPAED